MDWGYTRQVARQRKKGDSYWWWLSTEANTARWVVPQCEVLAADTGRWKAGLKGLRVNGSEVGAVRFGTPRTREHNRHAQKRKE
jgi:hypothetical protein